MRDDNGKVTIAVAQASTHGLKENLTAAVDLVEFMVKK